MSAPPDVDLRHLAPPPLSPPAVSSRRRGLLARVAVAALVVAVAALTLPDLVHLDHVTPFAQVVSFRPFVLAGVAALVLLAAGLSWRYRLLAPAAVALLCEQPEVGNESRLQLASRRHAPQFVKYQPHCK